MRVGIVAQRENAHAVYIAAEVRDALVRRDAEVAFDAATAEKLDGEAADSFDDADLVVSIGGDGTFLFAARRAGSTPVLGVNLGEVGFLNAVAPGEAVAAVEEEVGRFDESGAVRSHPVPRLRASGDDGEWELAPALNEVAIQAPRRGRGAGVSVEIRVDGELYAASHADGVMVATPTGSTAYNLSEGGPLVHPGVDGLVVTPMDGAEAMPPLVVDPDREVTVEATGGPSVAVSDGRVARELSPPTTVTVRRTDPPVRIAGPELDFFSALDKLR